MFPGATFNFLGVILYFVSFNNVSYHPINPLFTSTSLNSTIESIYQFRFDDAQEKISLLDSSTNIDLEIAQLYQKWWLALTYDVNSDDFDKMEEYSKSLLTKYEKPLSTKEQFIKLLSGIFLIRIAGIKGNKTLALKTFIKISSELKLVLKEPTASQENMLIAGVYHYSVGGIKMNNYLLKPFLALLPPANSYEGKIYLIECTKSNYNVIRTEAYYFLYKIDYEIYRLKSEAISHIKWLVNQYPNNLIFRLEQIKISEISGKLTPNHREDFIIMVNESELTKKQKDHFISKIDKLLQ